MRKLERRDNDFAESGRLDKAAQLAATIRAHYSPITDEVLEALPVQSYEWWVSLSKATHVKPPSPATVEACIGMLAAEMPMRSGV